jgi:hypothetical protein
MLPSRQAFKNQKKLFVFPKNGQWTQCLIPVPKG